MSEIMELIGSEDQRELDAVDEAADVKPKTATPAKAPRKVRDEAASQLLRKIVDAWIRDGGLSREVDAWIAAGVTDETVERIRQVLELMEAIR